MCSVYTMHENAKNITERTEKDFYLIYTLRIKDIET